MISPRSIPVGVLAVLLAVGSGAQAQMAQPGGLATNPGQVTDAYASGYQFGLSAQSIYSGGSNADRITGSAFGPYSMGERAEYGVWDIRFNPEGGYDDNIYLQPSSQQSGDWYYVLTPGAAYRLGSFDNNAIEFGCDANFIQYTKFTSSNYQQYLPYFRSHWTTGKTTFDVNNSTTVVGGGADSSFANELTLRTPQTANTGTVAMNTDISDKTAIGVDYLNFLFSPTPNNGFNNQNPLLQYMQNEGNIQVDWKAFAKIALYLRATVGHYGVDQGTGSASSLQSSSQYYGGGFIGARGDFTESGKLTGNARLGYIYYDTSNSGVSSSSNVWAYADISWKPTDDFQLVLSGVRNQIPSTIYGNGSAYTLSQGNLSLAYQFGPLLDNESTLRRFTFGPSFSYANTAYDSVANNTATYGQSNDPNMNLFTVNVGLEYRIQPYWTVYGNYSYQRNDSNIQNGSYYDNRLSLGSAFKF